jgi:hypothetical protein
VVPDIIFQIIYYVTFSQVWQCSSLRNINHILHPLLSFFLIVSVFSVLVPIRLLSPLVVGFVVVGERIFFISDFFQILIRSKMAKQTHKKIHATINFVKTFF